MIVLTDRDGNSIPNPKLTDIQKAINDLFLSKKCKKPFLNFVSLINLEELELQIYPQTLVIQDWGSWDYDGPGGPGELIRVRYKEGSLFTHIEEVVEFLENEEREKLIEIFNSLPKPEK